MIRLPRSSKLNHRDMINFEFWYFESKYQIFWVTIPSYGVLISIFMIIKKKISHSVIVYHLSLEFSLFHTYLVLPTLLEIQPVHSEGDQPWDFFGRNDAKAETPVLWPPHAKSWLIGKDSDAGRDWGQEEKGMTEDEMAGWHHGLDGCESEWTPGDGDGQGGLACCDSWSCKESDMTEWLNCTELNWSNMPIILIILNYLVACRVRELDLIWSRISRGPQ